MVDGAPLMVVAESRRQRRIVGHLDRGTDLSSALLEICAKYGVRAGEIRALGELEALEICEYDQSTKAYRSARRFACPFEILSFVGNITEKAGQRTLHAHVTVSRERDNGIEVLGGHLLSARVFSCEFVIEAWDDLLLRRGYDAQTGLSVWQEVFQETVPASPSSTRELAKTPPAQPVMVSPPPAEPVTADLSSGNGPHPTPPPPSDDARETHRSTDEETEIVCPLVGDILDHPTFGKAAVERIEGEGEFAQVRLRSGRLIRLSLEVLDLRVSGEDQGHRIFQATVRR